MQASQFCLLWAIFCFSCGGAQNAATLPDDIKQDIVNIVNGVMPTEGLVNPPPVVAENIKYYLYKSNNPNTPIEISASNIGALSISDPIYFLVHGWTQSYLTQWYNLTRDALFAKGSGFQVIAVDYEPYANLVYTTAQSNAEPVGNLIAQFVAALVQNHSVPIPKIVVIGHSLGGQVTGFLGKRAFQLLGQKLPRGIALDPAGPLFEGKLPQNRLAKTDYVVVHVIHTDDGKFGFLGDCGTIDFRANGGSLQPGCTQELIQNISQVTDEVFCDHHRSWWYFVEGVPTSPKFVSKKCLDINPFLYNGSLCSDTEEMCSLTTTKTGDFFCETNPTSPYSK